MAMTDLEASEETLDSVYQQIGVFGRIQKRIVIFCAIVSIGAAVQSFVPVFTLSTPRHRCRIPHVANDSYQVQGHHHMNDVKMFIPLDDNGDYEKCVVWKYHGNDTTSRQKVACSSWVYEKDIYSRTLASELNLVCDNKVLRSTANMCLFVGKIVGAATQGIASDRYGRRLCIIVCTLLMFASLLGNACISNLPLLFIFRFLTGATTTGNYLLGVVLSVELMNPTKRPVVITIMRLSIATGYLMLVGLAYLLRDWQHLHLALVWPSLLSVIGLFYLVESPRWLLSKKRDKEAFRVLRHMATVNRSELPESMLTRLVGVAKKPSVSPLSLFLVPRLALRWIVVFMNWLVIAVIYYGLTLNISNMSGDIFLNFTLISAVDFLGTVLPGFLANKVSRKYFYMTATMFSGLALAFCFLPVITYAPGLTIIVLSMIGKFAISTALYLVYIYSAELFPTSHRSFGLGSCSMSAHVGGTLAPYVADLSLFVDGPFGQVLPQIVCGVASLLAGTAVLILPETRGRPLPETIADAKDFSKRPRATCHPNPHNNKDRTPIVQ